VSRLKPKTWYTVQNIKPMVLCEG